jgi:hypothetical protein
VWRTPVRQPERFDSDRLGGIAVIGRTKEAVMETNVNHIVVEPRPDGRWARQRNGTKRAASLHDTQAEAEAALGRRPNGCTPSSS